MTTLYIDADACPVTREAIAAARARQVPVVLVGNATQNFDRHLTRAGV
ncbi:MAG TPA: YaiI/YqxD family protein, partial [Coriobacteriia bacterium]